VFGTPRVHAFGEFTDRIEWRLHRRQLQYDTVTVNRGICLSLFCSFQTTAEEAEAAKFGGESGASGRAHGLPNRRSFSHAGNFDALTKV
jgi:hypothetical protein